MMKRKLLALSSVALFLGGCVANIDPASEREVNEDEVLQPTYNDELEEIHEIVRRKELDDFDFVMKYDTIDYDLNQWRIIDNKALKISAWTESAPSDWDIMIEHVHIDLFITNKYADVPTLLQDSMDDKYHGYKQDGFKISDDVVYENIFGIIGATPELQKTVDWEGKYSLELKDLREEHFAKEDYDSNTLQVVYDVMVKKPDNDYYETIAVYDKIIIPVGYNYTTD